MGFDNLPKSYQYLDRHSQNNAYMISMYLTEQGNLDREIEHIRKSMKEQDKITIDRYCEYDDVGLD